MAHKNIEARGVVVAWDPTNPTKSLEELRDLVDEEAKVAIKWYWDAKYLKRITSQGIQFTALVLAALAGIAPIIVQITRQLKADLLPKDFDSGAFASLFVGVAAAILGLDRAFGYSTGWTRYVLTATTMNKLLHEFRLEWIAGIAAAGHPPTLEQQLGLVGRAKDFISAIQALILQETRDWATEFQTNMGRLEKELKVQLDELKAQGDQTAKEKESAARTGAIEVTLTNLEKADGSAWNARLQGAVTRAEDLTGSKVWSQINLPAGSYRIIVTAKDKDAVISTQAVVDVKPGETTKQSVTLA